MGGRGSGSRMSGGRSSVAESSAAYGSGGSQVRFSSQQMSDASDNYWNTGWRDKSTAAKILSGDLTEDEFVKQYAKDGAKADKAIQSRIDTRGRDYTNQNWSAKSKAEWEAEGRRSYTSQLDRAKQYSVGDTAKRLGVDINWSTSESEARRILGDSTYNALLEESRRGAKRAVESHKRRRG